MSGAPRGARPLHYLAAAALVVAVALAAHLLARVLPFPHVSVMFLAAVAAAAILLGFWPSIFAAVLSVGVSSFFFYAPIFSFRVADPRSVADLVVFVVVAAWTSRLAANLREQSLLARRRREVVEKLLAFSERVGGAVTEAEVQAAIREHAPGAGDAEYEEAFRGHAALALERARLRREVAEARLREQGEALREALLNSVSHDLRTPLAVILGSATTLEGLGEGAAPAARRELSAAIREEAERLSSYIENVLDLTRIRAGQLSPRLELVELSDIVNAALRRKQRALAAHRVEVRLPADLPMLRLDLFLMEHALANALDNAAKYSPEGSTVTVAAAREGAEVRLSVTDAGRGMDAALLAHAFEPFHRGGPADGRAVAGSGLGLAICRAFVQANGGRVALASAGAGRGSELAMHLPVPEIEVAGVDDD